MLGFKSENSRSCIYFKVSVKNIKIQLMLENTIFDQITSHKIV